MEIGGVAAMADKARTRLAHDHVAIRHARQGRGILVQRFAHLLHGVRFQDARVAKRAVAEMCEHEARHVGARRGGGAGGHDVPIKLERLGDEAAILEIVAERHVFGTRAR